MTCLYTDYHFLIGARCLGSLRLSKTRRKDQEKPTEVPGRASKKHCSRTVRATDMALQQRKKDCRKTYVYRVFFMFFAVSWISVRVYDHFIRLQLDREWH